MSGPPRRWHVNLVLIATAALLIDWSCPGHRGFGSTSCFALALVLVGVIAIDYVVRVMIVIDDRIAGFSREDRSQRPPSWGRWVISPLCFIVLATALVSEFPVRLRFRVGLVEFEMAVQSGAPPNQPRIIGSFAIAGITRHSNGTLFFKTGGGVMGSAGFLYCPRTMPFGEYEPKPVLPLAPKWHLGCWEF